MQNLRDTSETDSKEAINPLSAADACVERVDVDIFTFDYRDYLVCVDYLSGFFEID